MTNDKQINMRIVEKLLNTDALRENVSSISRKGKIQLFFMLREAERTPNNEEIEYDVTDYTETSLKDLVQKYDSYISFGFP